MHLWHRSGSPVAYIIKATQLGIVNCGNSAGQYNILSVPVALEAAEKTAKMWHEHDLSSSNLIGQHTLPVEQLPLRFFLPCVHYKSTSASCKGASNQQGSRLLLSFSHFHRTLKLRLSLLSGLKLTSAIKGDWWICHGNYSNRRETIPQHCSHFFIHAAKNINLFFSLHTEIPKSLAKTDCCMYHSHVV